MANPLIPIKELLEKVEKERAQQIVVAFKASPELVDRIDSYRQSKDDWTRSDAVKDLVERGMSSLVSETR